MYCPVCGKQIPDGSLFCRYCGEELSGGSSGSVNAPVASVPAVYAEAQPRNQKDDLVLSVVGLALAAMGELTGASIAGLVLSIIGRKKALRNAEGSPMTGKNKVAYILSTIGIPVGIAITLFTAVYWLSEILQFGIFERILMGQDAFKAAFSLFLG